MAHFNQSESATGKSDLSACGELQTLTLEETTQVGGGCPLVVIAIAIACAVLLSHD
jgi:hypothetical protein